MLYLYYQYYREHSSRISSENLLLSIFSHLSSTEFYIPAGIVYATLMADEKIIAVVSKGGLLSFFFLETWSHLDSILLHDAVVALEISFIS